MTITIHPSHKLAYFSQAGWDDEWRATTEEIMQAEFERVYADIEVMDSQNTQNVSNCLLILILSDTECVLDGRHRDI